MGKQRKRVGAEDTSSATAELMDSLGYSFRNPALLRLALTHRSFVYETRLADSGAPPSDPFPYGSFKGREGRNPPGSDNEQLEFLGDAVLGLVVTELLFREFPDRSEGELTRMRASLVSRDRLATLGTQLGLDRHLLLGASAEENGARTKPAVIADVTEAVLAAIYRDANAATQLDSESGPGADGPPSADGPLSVSGLSHVQRLIRQHLLEPALPDLRLALDGDSGRGALRDFKTLLQERVQAGKAGRLLYVDVAEEGPPHQRRFTVEARLEAADGSALLASAEGNSKKEAQQRAAESALEAWPVVASRHPSRTTVLAAEPIA